MREKGGSLLAISVDPPEDSLRVVEQEHLPFPILSDAARQVVKSYGLLHAGGGLDGEDIAIPAQLLLERDGRIVWRHVARRIQDRAYPAETLAPIGRL